MSDFITFTTTTTDEVEDGNDGNEEYNDDGNVYVYVCNYHDHV